MIERLFHADSLPTVPGAEDGTEILNNSRQLGRCRGPETHMATGLGHYSSFRSAPASKQTADPLASLDIDLPQAGDELVWTVGTDVHPALALLMKNTVAFISGSSLLCFMRSTSLLGKRTQLTTPCEITFFWLYYWK